MKVVITGDVVNSRRVESSIWLPALKDVLSIFGAERADWEIYRGDSFQLVLPAADGLDAVFALKVAIKRIVPLDVRMALGLGTVEHQAGRVLESNGTAFVHSGECFEKLKKETLRIKSGQHDWDEGLNIMFSMVEYIVGTWKPVTTEILYHRLKYPGFTQKKLADLMGRKSQASISEGLKRGGYAEIRNVINYFKNQFT